MYEFEHIFEFLESLLDSKRRRHIIGGVLLSMSALFGGLAITAMTIPKEEKDDKK